ncbi:MO15-related protein kinase [Plasmodium knowlesi strain H]|uniref:Cyclin-dependent kinase 2 homolog n=3 Tax=Plasmodium knowlesi TaxID=5850 RepID=A0A5K1V4P2_PLAKH|nr:MO15-related protein kinase [Plasmodium knowlesi strain H]OTN65868.1 putative Cdk7 [Plasmodium knowlesi]CAA9987788.1 MO15-related protein kinase [Plasmodium knowlesi strain H]SBO22442.1 MO15-related protein kinase [Plasmodium knowlesi strain H]SBO29541.1 MO15-related protein kinase [Plasmodium knowlesi strain H]VVS77262.1 MO15-related protein kinase [Plasmodium knowlesi strain H]|eukprot:XP_002258785.1 cdk7, putative [Plasmodium knowlesi strain H]
MMETNSTERYIFKPNFLGEGSYGKVYKAYDTILKKEVAIKKMKINKISNYIDECGINFVLLREIKIMKEIKHQNIMTALDLYCEKDYINLVMEIMDYDLAKIINRKVLLTDSQKKCILLQILNGLNVLHKYYFMHRDLSPANIFINKKGEVKIADFGLSSKYAYDMYVDTYSKDKYNKRTLNLTSKVVTLWYRAPELLMGSNKYNSSVDMWSFGCIFAELHLQKALFPGENEIDQLGKIFFLLGTPNEDNWPEALYLPLYTEFTKANKKDFKNILKIDDDDCIDLLMSLLRLNSHERITAEEAMKHKYFFSDPLPCDVSQLPFNDL